MPKPKPPVLGTERPTNLLVWFFAFICAIVAIIVIIAGIVVFVGYLAIRPKVPLIYVHAARLDNVIYDQASNLAVRLTIILKAENDNQKASANFYHTRLTLHYRGLRIAQLVADPFHVEKNMTQELNYVVESSPIPLGSQEQYLTQESLEKTRVMPFFLQGNSRTRWRVASLGSVRFWLHMNCHFLLPINSSVVYPRCSTKSH